MKPAWNRALAVGVLAAVTATAFVLALTFFRKGGYSERDSYLVHAYFSDATGLTWKSRAQIAGIQVGEVVGIGLAGTKARLDIRVKNGIELHTDTCLTKSFPSALLPDALLEVQPGSPEQPLLSTIPEEQRKITCVREAVSVQALMNSLSKIAADVQHITGDLAGEKGIREIVANLADATKRIDLAIARNEENVAAVIDNAAAFTRDIRDITARDKDKVGRIASNIEELTKRLNVIAVSLQEIIEPGSSRPGPGGGGGAAGAAGASAAAGAAGSTGAAGAPGAAGKGAEVPPGVSSALAAATPEERAKAAEQARGVKQAVDRLNDSLEKLDQIVSKVNEGKIGDAAEGLADQYERIYKLQVQVQLRSEWLLKQSGAKTYFGIRLLPRPDKYFLVEIVSDPRGVDNTTSYTTTTRDPVTGADTTTVATQTVHEQKLTFTLQIAKRYGPVTFRAGIVESSGGVGSDLHLFDDHLQLSVSVYQFSRPYQDVFPRAKIYANWYMFQHFYATAGSDDFLNSWRTGRYPGGPKFSIGTDVFFGAGIYFTDDDLKTLIGAGAGSATSIR